LARLYTVRKALSDIPKRYMPVKKIDVPKVSPRELTNIKPVHKLISTELTRSAIIRHSTLPNPSHPGLSPPDHPHFPSTSYTPIILHSAILIMSKASRFRRSLGHRKNETLRQYIMRARDEGLWRDEVTSEGLLVWLDKYEAVRFQGVELTETEFLNTMKLVYFLLLEMKPPQKPNEYVESVHSSSESPYSSENTSIYSGIEGTMSRQPTNPPSMLTEGDVLRQMESLIVAPRRSGESASVNSMIDHGSVMEDVMDEEHERRMRGGRLGEREGSVIYYDVD
jgi:hypothetical protein